jgi:Ca-activated chloride channel family protein
VSHDWTDDPRVLSYLLGELQGEERAAIDAALADGDAALRAEIASLEAFLPELRESMTPAGGDGPEIGSSTLAAIQRAGAETRAAANRRIWMAASAAAAVGLVALGIHRLGPTERSKLGDVDVGAIVNRSGDPAAYSYDLSALGYGAVADSSAIGTLRSIGYLGGGFDLEDVETPTIEDNPFVLTTEDALSTFSIDVDTASYSRARALIERGRFPRPEEVRAEEFINYFSYGDAAPAHGSAHPMAVTASVGAAPWAPEHRLVRIGLAAERIEFEERPPANLVFLVDVSGSMSNAMKLPLVVKALALLTESLAPDDRIAIVVYAQSEGLVLESTPIAAREAILQALESLDAGGSTNGGAGIQLAYRVAREHFVEGGVNRVILCTDGDFNVGMTSDEALEDLIAAEAAGGVDLTLLGFGGGSYRDKKMEKLSNRGNGNFAFIDSEREARKVLAKEVAGTLVTVARDTKVQIEWNPDLVQSVRQIGYENRLLAHADFANDAVDAGEMGAGHVVTALFEVVPEAGALLSGGAELGEVRVRYKRQVNSASEVMTVPIQDGGATFDEAPEALRFSAAAAAFAMVMRGSPHAGEATLDDVRRWGLGAIGSDPGALRNAFIALVERAMELGGK